jgi:hypothetical protein
MVTLALLSLSLLQAPAPPPPVSPPQPAGLLEIARTYRDAIDGATRSEKEVSDLQVRVVVFPDAQRWLLLEELIASLDAGESPSVTDERLAKGRKTWRSAAGRPGFRIGLRHREAADESDRALPRTVHLFPGDPERMLRAMYGEKVADWSPLAPPTGMSRTKVRIAKHFTTKQRRTVPFIKELEPKGARWLFDGEEAMLLGVLPAALADKKEGEELRIELLAFERFRGPSPEPDLLDLNAEESTFDRDQSLALVRSWPPPWPPIPAELAAILAGDE